MTQLAQINPQDLQNPMQQAIAQVSKAQQFIDAVLKACGDNYLPVSELIHKPEISKLVDGDSNKLSIKLSDAYTRGKLSRVDHPVGTTKYAYGKYDPEQALTSQKAPRSATPRTPAITAHKPVRMMLVFPDADEALSFLMHNRSALKYLANE